MGKIVRLDSLSSGEAIWIEGNISRFSDSELEGMLPPGTSGISLKSSLARGELVVLSDTSAVPLFTSSNGKLVANTSNQISITNQALSQVKQRFLSKKPSFGASKPTKTDDFVSFSEANNAGARVLQL